MEFKKLQGSCKACCKTHDARWELSAAHSVTVFKKAEESCRINMEALATPRISSDSLLSYK